MTTITTAGLIPLPPSVHHTTQRLTHREAHTQLSTFLSLAENYAAYRPDSTLSERGPQASAGTAVTTLPNTTGSTGAGQSNLTLHHLRHILLGIEGKRIGGPTFENGLFGRKSRHGDERVVSSPNKRKRDRMVETAAGDAVVTDYETVQTPRQSGKKRKQYLDDDGDEIRVNDQNAGEGEWQDKEVYEHEDDTFSDDGTRRNHVTERENQDPEGGELSMENDRHPGADLVQPRTEQDERNLVEIEVGEKGEKVDPRKQSGIATGVESKAQNKNGRREGKSGESPAMSKEEKKRLKKLRLKEEQKAKYKEKEKKNQMSV